MCIKLTLEVKKNESLLKRMKPSVILCNKTQKDNSHWCRRYGYVFLKHFIGLFFHQISKLCLFNE